MSFRLRSGEVRSYGGTGGAPTAPFELQHGEAIVRVEQWGSSEYLGSRILFETSFGRQSEIVGERYVPGLRAHAAVAVDNRDEIIGLTFDVIFAGFESIASAPFAPMLQMQLTPSAPNDVDPDDTWLTPS